MDKAQAIDAFWNSFGWKAYDEGTVPDNAEMPRITYNVVTDSIGDSVLMHASLWDRSTSWARISKKAEEIGKAIEERTHKLIVGGVLKTFYPSIPIDDPAGRVFITKGSPFAQRMLEPSDDMVRRIYLNINVEFFTAY